MADFSESQLKKKTVAELTKIVEDNSIEVDEDAKKPDLIEAITAWQEHKAASGNDDEELDDDEEEDDVPAPPADDEEEDDAPVDTEEEDDLELPEEDEVDTEPAKPAAKAKKASPAKQTKYTEGGKSDDGEKLLGAKEVAAAIGTDAKSLRQFFRSGKSSHFTAVGAGGRYEFKESDVEAIGKEFTEYKAGKPGRGRGASEGGESKPRASRKGKAEVAPEQVIDEVEEIEDLEELEGDEVEEIDDAQLEDDEEED